MFPLSVLRNDFNGERSGRSAYLRVRCTKHITKSSVNLVFCQPNSPTSPPSTKPARPQCLVGLGLRGRLDSGSGLGNSLARDELPVCVGVEMTGALAPLCQLASLSVLE